MPALAFNVPFPRLEIVLEGQLNEQGLPLAASTLTTLQVLYVQAGEVDAAAVDRPGHYPEHSVWSAKLGFSIQRWDGKSLHTEKQNVSGLGRAWVPTCC